MTGIHQYTAIAYHDRTSLPCAPLSFKDISEGALSALVPESFGAPDGSPGGSSPPPIIIEMVICSFALHLVENSSQLFSLLWELSLKSRWLVVVAPHKKPEVSSTWKLGKMGDDLMSATDQRRMGVDEVERRFMASLSNDG